MSSITQYYTTQEVNKDHEKKCDKCGENFSVVWRIFGKGFDSASNSLLSNFTNAHDRAANRASQSAQRAVLDKAINQTIFWHRCTNCGYYSDSDLDTINKSFKSFRRHRRPLRFLCWLFGGLLFSFFPAGLLAIIALLIEPEIPKSPDDPQNPSLLAFTIMSLLSFFAGGLPLWFGWWVSSKRRFDKNLVTLNSEDKTSLWLDKWKTDGVYMAEDVRNHKNVVVRETDVEKLRRLQFGKDLVSPYFAHSSDYKN